MGMRTGSLLKLLMTMARPQIWCARNCKSVAANVLKRVECVTPLCIYNTQTSVSIKMNIPEKYVLMKIPELIVQWIRTRYVLYQWL